MITSSLFATRSDTTRPAPAPLSSSLAPGLLFRVTAPHFVAGVVLENNTVVRAAPILKYMMGWSWRQVRHYCICKHWIVETNRGRALTVAPTV